MPFLSPAKLLVIVVIALVVLGPDKLPTVAKQIGGLWRDFRRFREKLESEVRGSFPDLPSTDTITRAVRSPLAFLDNLAETDGSGNEPASDVAAGAGSPDGPGSEVGAAFVNRPAGTVQSYEMPSPIPELSTTAPGGIAHRFRSDGGAGADDPGMN
ncbi:MAG: twin-arginine translocase TatA/TatE family subunit [Acidimicrobiales bacterium]